MIFHFILFHGIYLYVFSVTVAPPPGPCKVAWTCHGWGDEIQGIGDVDKSGHQAKIGLEPDGAVCSVQQV
jgi:hypothetical protein